MSFARTLGSFVSILSVMAFATPAFADAISPEEAACQGKKAGDVCTETMTTSPFTGVCADSTCEQISYLPDGGHSGGSSPCVVCEATDAGTAADGGPHSATGDGGTTRNVASSSCSMAVAKKGANAAAPIFIAGLIPLVLRRRNKNKK